MGLTKDVIKALGNFGAKTSEIEKIGSNVAGRFEYLSNGGKSRFLGSFKSADEFQDTFSAALKTPGEEASVKFLQNAAKEGLFDGTKVSDIVKGHRRNFARARTPKTQVEKPVFDTTGEELGRADKQLRRRLKNDINNFHGMLRKSSSEKDLSDLASHYDLDYIKGMNSRDLKDAMAQKIRERLEEGPGFMDYFNGYHGKSILGVGTAGTAATTLFTSKGRLSNNELYSDPFA